jgi:hypothetical protein
MGTQRDRPTRAMRVLDAQEKFADYPFDDVLVRRTFGNKKFRGKKLEEARQLAKELISNESQHHEAFVRNFLQTMDRLYPGSGFQSLGFTFFNTDVPNAVTIHVESDGSYGVGLDYGSVSIFSFTFPTLLYSRLNNLENLEWVRALLDIIQIQLLGEHEPSRQRSIVRLAREHEIEAPASRALEMAFRFLIAHELGHIKLGHFENKVATRLSSIGTGTDQDKVSIFDHDSEFAADAWAADALRKVANENPLEQTLACYVPGLIFGIQSLAKEIYEPRTPLARHLMNSHPDPWERAKRLFPINHTAEQSPDPVIRAISDLPKSIATERANPDFNFAAEHVRMTMAAAQLGLLRRVRPWWKFWL